MILRSGNKLVDTEDFTKKEIESIKLEYVGKGRPFVTQEEFEKASKEAKAKKAPAKAVAKATK